METLNKNLLTAVQMGFNKQAFVPMPGGQTEPVAGASPMTAGMVAPLGGQAAPPGMDQMAGPGGMPQDPAAGGGMPPGGPMPADPAMMGVDPMTGQPMGAPPMDPAAAGGADPAAAAGGDDPIQMIIDGVVEALTPIIEKASKSSGGGESSASSSSESSPAPSAEPSSGGDVQSQILEAVQGTNALLQQAMGPGGM
jgi:hypothetical protein